MTPTKCDSLKYLNSFAVFLILFDCFLPIKLQQEHIIFTLIAKIILSGLSFVLSLLAADKTQYFVHLSFYSSLQLINGILRDLQNLFKYFNGAGITEFF